MKILLSPAKSINFEKPLTDDTFTQPFFLDKSEYLIGKLRKMSARKIGKLMSVSNDIANLNYNRFQDWHLPFTNENSKPAADIFTGTVYQGLDYSSLSSQERERGQDYLRILSGLYGVLKPLDLIQPYRLEMGTRFAVTPKLKNLYLFWGDQILNALSDELKNDDVPVLINLASSEYFKAAKLKDLNYQVITPIFKDKNKSGEYKVIMTFAKKARGLMARYIIQNEIKDIEDLKAFNIEGYSYMVSESSDNEMVFFRN